MAFIQSIRGTHGNLVTFEMPQLKQFISSMNLLKKRIVRDVDAVTIEIGVWGLGELKMGIAGKRDQTKSVDTGHFINDTRMDKVGKGIVVLHAPQTPYAKFLEEGTSRGITGRHHFGKTRANINKEASKKMQDKIQRGIESWERMAKGTSWQSTIPKK